MDYTALLYYVSNYLKRVIYSKLVSKVCLIFMHTVVKNCNRQTIRNGTI